MPGTHEARTWRTLGGRYRAVLASVGLIALATACSAPGTVPGSLGDAEGDRPRNTVGVALPEEARHVHGAGVDPETGEVLVASHAGLYTLPAPEEAGDGDVEPAHVGPEIDLMGFAVQGPGHYLASGHPEGDTDMPDPVGLIETRDGGQSWEALSLAGESDFHALTSNDDRVFGFDGALRATGDGVDWDDLDPSVQAFSLAVSDDGETVLATTERGLLRSTDGGADFEAVPDAPMPALVSWVRGGDRVFAITLDGTVHLSEDAGLTWERTGALPGTPEALYADDEQVIVVADLHVARSTDEGAGFDAW
ncbi:F510_1955 family glycosylhydrolase [Nocardiopsis alba]|uniref:F510_1955 family glycosylhydrolase n=1 Tax=Nocardiopsis alba TaxID=53437 RepID=UPI0033B2D0ED